MALWQFEIDLLPSDGWPRYPDDTTDDLQLWHGNGRVESLTARIDCRGTPSYFLARIHLLAIALGLSVTNSESRTVIDPTLEALTTAAMQSRAAAFALIPQGHA